MKHLILIFVLSLVGTLNSSAQTQDESIPKATTLEEVEFRHGEPVNCTYREYRKMKRQRQRNYNKLHGNRWIDRTGRAMVGLGRGFVNFCVYVGTAVAITAGTIWVIEATRPS